MYGFLAKKSVCVKDMMVGVVDVASEKRHLLDILLHEVSCIQNETSFFSQTNKPGEELLPEVFMLICVTPFEVFTIIYELLISHSRINKPHKTQLQYKMLRMTSITSQNTKPPCWKLF